MPAPSCVLTMSRFLPVIIGVGESDCVRSFVDGLCGLAGAILSIYNYLLKVSLRIISSKRSVFELFERAKVILDDFDTVKNFQELILERIDDFVALLD